MKADTAKRLKAIREHLAIRRRVVYVFRLLPIKKNKIVFDNFSGGGYGDDPKYICEELRKCGRRLDLVWLLRKDIKRRGTPDIPSDVRIVPYGTIRSMYEMMTAHIWVDNVKTTYKPVKRKGQFYLQTWHASMGIKPVERDARKTLPKAYLRISRADGAITDLMYSNNNFCRNQFRRAFYYSGKVLKCSVPRCSVLYSGSETAGRKVRSFFGIPDDLEMVLYAPTLRSDGDASVCRFDYRRFLGTLKKQYARFMGLEIEKEFVMLLRLHPGMADKSGRISFGDGILNATFYPDIQELLAASGVLLTDYSSCMFDAAFVKKPVFLYTPDYEAFCRDDRGVYFSCRELPFGFNGSEEELNEYVRHFSYERYVKNCESFFDRIGLEEDGTGAEQVAGLLLKRIEGENG